MESTTNAGYQTSLGILENFCRDTPAKKNLTNFLNWWDQRRIHWSRAYKTNLYAPTTNLAEVVNASFVHGASTNLTLLKAAQEDTAESIIVETMWKKYQEGNPTTGYGPSFEQAQQISARRQLDAAQQMSVELDELELNTAIPNNTDETIDLSCKHRPFTEKERYIYNDYYFSVVCVSI